MDDIISTTAKERFGIDYLFPYHQVVLLPTGAGKSLCFMLPACLLEGLTIVAFPLLGLMADQLRRVEEAGMTGILLKGGMSRQEKEETWQAIESGKVQMLLTNPEMLILPDVRRRLAGIRISHLVLDEAHTIPEWGESFRPASPLILEEIKSILFDGLSFNLIRADPGQSGQNEYSL